jgi:Spy/CpxP family protein refolding chaperone
MKKLIHALMVAGLMATAGGAAIAQPGAMMGHEGMGGMMAHGDPAKMEQMHAKHLADTKAKLKITAAQEAAWNTFADSMKPSPEMKAPRPDHTELDKLPTPERIDAMRAMHKSHMASMEAAMDKRGEATKTFYAVLSPEQKKVFDAEFAHTGHGGGHGMHGPMKGPMMDKGATKPAAPAKP